MPGQHNIWILSAHFICILLSKMEWLKQAADLTHCCTHSFPPALVQAVSGRWNCHAGCHCLLTGQAASHGGPKDTQCRHCWALRMMMSCTQVFPGAISMAQIQWSGVAKEMWNSRWCLQSYFPLLCSSDPLKHVALSLLTSISLWNFRRYWIHPDPKGKIP